jgi:hypothetical protein
MALYTVQTFRKKVRLSIVKMEVVNISETVVTTYDITLCYNGEGHNLNVHRPQNFVRVAAIQQLQSTKSKTFRLNCHVPARLRSQRRLLLVCLHS